MNYLHLIIFTVKMGLESPLFSATRLKVSKIDPVVIGSSCRRCEMLPLLSPSILYYHILPLLRLQKNSASALQSSWHPGFDEKIHLCAPFNLAYSSV